MEAKYHPVEGWTLTLDLLESAHFSDGRTIEGKLGLREKPVKLRIKQGGEEVNIHYLPKGVSFAQSTTVYVLATRNVARTLVTEGRYESPKNTRRDAVCFLIG